MSQLITQVTMSAQVSMVNEVFLVLGWLCVLVIATLIMALPWIIPKRKSHSVAVKFNAITDVEKEQHERMWPQNMGYLLV